MKTRCTSCQTVFRVTPEQLKARGGQVRCGQCRTVFNALDSLLDGSGEPSGTTGSAPPPPPPPAFPEIVPPDIIAASEPSPHPAEAPLPSGTQQDAPPPPEDNEPPPLDVALAPPATEASFADPILPRDTTEIPGYSKWAEGALSAPALPAPAASRRLLAFTLLLLCLALVVQLLFHYRDPLARSAPALRPALELLSEAAGTTIPLPRDVELVGIEASDLQVDARRGKLLTLQATLRNRAPYAQAWPLLELSLTDTGDNAIVRRIFQPAEYLPDGAEPAFAAGTDVALRLWIDAGGTEAAGYRLYVFYP